MPERFFMSRISDLVDTEDSVSQIAMASQPQAHVEYQSTPLPSVQPPPYSEKPGQLQDQDRLRQQNQVPQAWQSYPVSASAYKLHNSHSDSTEINV